MWHNITQARCEINLEFVMVPRARSGLSPVTWLASNSSATSAEPERPTQLATRSWESFGSMPSCPSGVELTP